MVLLMMYGASQASQASVCHTQSALTVMKHLNAKPQLNLRQIRAL